MTHIQSNDQNVHEKNAVARALLDTIKKRIDETIHHENLVKVAQGKITQDQFRDFAINHYHSGSEWFMKLLVEGSKKLRDFGYDEIADEFDHNYNDEEGIKNGALVLEENHETWRQRYGRALGIEPEKTVASENIKRSIIDPSLKALEERSPYFLIGWLAATEWYTTMEFKQIKQGRDVVFPEKFVVTENDDAKTIKEKELNSQYINDHITHDISHTTDVLLPLAGIIIEARKNGGQLHGYDVETEINDAIEFVVKCQKDFLDCSMEPIEMSLAIGFVENREILANKSVTKLVQQKPTF